MEQICLLVKTKDKRKFLTHEKNFSLLKEFARTFNTEICRVSLNENAKVLELKTLVSKFCDDPNYSDETQYEILERLFPEKNRSSVLKDAAKIRKFIRKRLEKNKPLSLSEIKEKYSDLAVTDACLCNHFSAVRKELEDEGLNFKKVGAGKYQIK